MLLFLINSLSVSITFNVILLALFITTLYIALKALGYFNKPGLKILFRKPIPNSDSQHNMSVYRTWSIFLKDTKGVFYTRESIQQYLHNFDAISKDKMVGKPGYDWVVGFYPMYVKDKDGKTRLDFLVVPTPAQVKNAGKNDEDISNIYDFYEALNLSETEKPNSPYLKKASPNPSILNDDIAEDIGYNTGHIYP